ncbi:MAG: dTMP kinase [Acidobacteriota bacterium]|nr:dTMP kinase [Acidobacteriota bacterium]
MKPRGCFITIEGMDGTGKSTQLRMLAAWLRRRGFKPLITREPGGTRVGAQVRRILLASANKNLFPIAELLLMYADRSLHLEEVIRPALKRGELVISDRFADSSLAYQGYGRRMGEEPVRRLETLVCGPTRPHLTILLDAPPRLALRRAERRGDASNRRRFENAGSAFQARVRKGYLKIARLEPARVKIVHSDRPAKAVQTEIREIVSKFLRKHYS